MDADVGPGYGRRVETATTRTGSRALVPDDASGRAVNPRPPVLVFVLVLVPMLVPAGTGAARP